MNFPIPALLGLIPLFADIVVSEYLRHQVIAETVEGILDGRCEFLL